MNEQVKPCLQEVADAVHQGADGVVIRSRMGEMLIERLMHNGETPTDAVACDIQNCAVAGMLLNPESDDQKLFDLDGACKKLHFDMLPKSPDEKGCKAAQYSYALAKLGISMSPQEVDIMTGRRSDELFQYEYEEALIAGLLKQNLRVEQIHALDADTFEDYVDLTPQAAYERYYAEMVSTYGEAYVQNLPPSFMNPEAFAEDVERYKHAQERIAEVTAEGNGEYILSKQDITSELLQKKLEQHVVLFALRRSGYATHSVVLEEIRPVGKQVFLKYFDPGSDYSTISTMRTYSLLGFIEEEPVITLLSKRETSEEKQ